MRHRRGQSTVELALIAPVMALLIGGTLQVGTLVSDQINLNQAAYEAELWAVANPTTATVDSGGTSGTIAQHAYAQLCGGATAPPSSTGTRFCARVAGIPDLNIAVSARATPVAGRLPSWPVTDALADDNGNCDSPPRSWSLSASPATASIAPGATQSFTVTLATSGAGADPSVALNVTGYPTNLASGNPAFNPPSISPISSTSTLAIRTRTDTPTGTYSLVISGQDQCSGGPNGGPRRVTLTITGTPPSPSPSPVSSTPAIASVNPNNLCGNSPQTLTIHGSNFANGSTVSVGATGATAVTVTGTTQIVATLPALAAGTFNVTVTVPGAGATTIQNGVTVVAICATATPTSTSANGCAPGSGKYQTVITITWYEPLVINIVGGAGAGSHKLTARQVGGCQ